MGRYGEDVYSCLKFQWGDEYDIYYPNFLTIFVATLENALANFVVSVTSEYLSIWSFHKIETNTGRYWNLMSCNFVNNNKNAQHSFTIIDILLLTLIANSRFC